jgi:hypothetical protein
MDSGGLFSTACSRIPSWLRVSRADDSTAIDLLSTCHDCAQLPRKNPRSIDERSFGSLKDSGLFGTVDRVSIEPAFLAGVRASAGDPAAAWLERASESVAGGTRDRLLDAYTQASHHLGQRPFRPASLDDATLAQSGVVFDKWIVEDAGRLLLLLARHRSSASLEAFIGDAVACFEQADAREQKSWLRAVSLLPEPARFLSQTVDACRTNILPLFESVACENPYPADFFPDLNFNQMVLKALFNGVALARVIGLKRRLNPDLARMATDYAAERRAAGRTIPADILLVTQA